MLGSMPERMVGAALLKVDTFEDVEHDRSATLQAALVVVLSAISGGVGSLISSQTSVVDALLFGILGGVLSWAVWALVTWVIGTTILKTAETQADWGQMARGTGFAQTPGILNILVAIPSVGIIIFYVLLVWKLAAMVVAVRQSLDYTSTWRAFFVVLIGFIIVAIILGVLYSVLGIGGGSTS